MGNEIKYIQDKAFDNGIVEHLDVRSIEAAIEEGNRCLQYQFETIGQLRGNCTMILGWLIGAMLALIGYIALEMTSDQPELVLLLTAGYELVFCFITAFVIIYGTMYKRTVFLPGDSPSHFFRESVMSRLQDVADKSKYTQGWHLSEIQFKILQNDKEQMHEVKKYRLALALMLSGLLSGVLLLMVLLLVL